MSWLGKLVGGTIGFAIGGPLGAILGITFGQKFDSESNSNHRKKSKYAQILEQHQLTFFTATFSMLAKLVKADGSISKEEIHSIENFINKDLKLKGHSKNIAINIFNTALNSPQTFDAFAKQLYDQFHDQKPILELMLDIMIRISISDGHLSHEEEELLIIASNIFNFTKKDYNQIKSKYIDINNQKYYSVLGCNENESIENLKKYYRHKVREFHPDKIAAKGLPKEFTEFSQNKFREIQEAWDYIKKDRNIK